NGSAERLSLPDHMDHICEEVSSLHSKLGAKEYFIEVKDDLKSQAKSLGKFYLDVQSMQTQLNNIQSLLESAVIIDDTTEGEKTKKANDVNTAATQEEHQSAETLVESQGEQPANVKVANKESAPPAPDNKPSEGKELVVHNSEKKKSEWIISVEDDSDEDDKQPISKRFKILTPIPNIPNPTLLNTFVLEHLLKSKEQQKSMQEFTDQLFKTTSSRFSPTPPREPTPPRDSSKGKAVAIIEEPGNELGSLSKEKYDKQIKELKRISDLKAKKEKSEQELRKLLNPATLKAQAQKWTEHEAKKAKMMEEYNHQISYRADPLPITKISYVVNSRKEATMKITRGDNPLNLIVHPNFRLKTLSFSEWLSLKAKFQWVINQAKRLGLPPVPELTTFRLTAEEKKRKMTEFIKEVFITGDVRVDGMDRNLIPPPGVLPIQVLVINEPESGIFCMNRNTKIGFQRESEFHLTPTTELIRLQKQIKS
ncbi:hypothetical protein Tco_1423475, partial [Tanacetum coccineum]